MAILNNQSEKFKKIHNESFDGFIDEVEFIDKMNLMINFCELEVNKASTDKKKQEIWGRSLPNRIIKVNNRILLVQDLLAKINNADNFLQVYMYPGLITYLVLTCFDQLGQPVSGWIFFPDWIKSSKLESEVQKSIAKVNDRYSDELFEIKCSALYGEYHSIYGVKNSFYRFINEILPQNISRRLLDNILVERWNEKGRMPDKGNQEDDVLKKKWLFKTRNDYTHNLFTVETNMANGKYFNGEKWLQRETVQKSKFVEVFWVTEDFTESLIEALKIGILELVNTAVVEINKAESPD